MKQDFIKMFGLGSEILKFLNPSNTLTWRQLPNQKQWINREDTVENASNLNYWDDYYKLNDIQNNIILNGLLLDWTLLDLNALNDPNLFSNKVLNKKGYNTWNTNFDKLGLNERYFGLDKNKFDYLGPTTWSRYALISNLQKTYNEKNPLTTRFGQIYYDGKEWKRVGLNPTVGYLPKQFQLNINTNKFLVPRNYTIDDKKTDLETIKENIVTENQGDVIQGNSYLTQGNGDSTNGNGNSNINTGETDYSTDFWWLGRTREPFTSWIPHTTNLLNIIAANNRIANQKKKLKVPLLETPQYVSKIRGTYEEGKAFEKQNAELLNQASLYKTASLPGYLEVQKQLSNLLGQRWDKFVQGQKAAVDASTQNAVNTANKNTELEVAGRNQNIQNARAHENMIINANAERIAKNSAALVNAARDLWKEGTEYTKTQRLNDIGWANQQYKRELAQANQLAGELYNKSLDYTNSDIWQNMINGKNSEFQKLLLNKNGTHTDFVNAVMSGDGVNAKLDIDKLKALWNSENETLKPFIDLYKVWRDNQEKQYYRQLFRNQNAYDAATARFNPDFVTGEGFYNPNTYRYRPMGLVYKSGGSVKRNARFIDYINHILKESHNVRANNQKSADRVQKELMRELNDLDKETLMLLRSVFK